MLEQQRTVRAIPAADHVIRYALALVRLTRKDEGSPPDFIEQYVSWGAGPRASQNLILGAKANAALDGREFASTDDVREVAPAVLRHRVITNFNAEADGITPDEIVRRLIKTVPADGSDADVSNRLSRMFRSA